MDHDMRDTNPWGKHSTHIDTADRILGYLHSDPNPIRRYHTIQRLGSGGELQKVAAHALAELRAQHGSITAAAEAVGISRQAAREMLAKVGVPTKATSSGENQLGYTYGQYLAVVGSIADTAANIRGGTSDPVVHWYSLLGKAWMTVGVMPAIERTAATWLDAVSRRRPEWADPLAEQHTTAVTNMHDWLDRRGTNPYLTVVEQWGATIGYHRERERIYRNV